MRTAMVDYIERLPEDSEGNRNIVVIVDCFMRLGLGLGLELGLGLVKTDLGLQNV